MRSESEVEKWLKENSISKYIIFDNLQVSVHGNVNLNGKLHIKELPIKFKEVDGYFDISNNHLTSLEGCPDLVTKDFNCSNNKIESLKGSPSKVGDFDCSNNSLFNLAYSPKEIFGFFNCSNNQLATIKGSPRTIKGYFNCSNNKIVSLKGGPKYVDTYFDCSENLLDELLGGPVTVGQDYICYDNDLKDLDNVADEIGWDLITDIRLNHLTSSFDENKKNWRYKGSEVIAHVYKPIVALSNKDDINRWLVKHDIKNFTILSDNSVNVHGSVKLSNQLANLSKLPLDFNEVDGNFDISDNELISLEGSPKKVSGDFLCFKNELSSLKGSPKEVGGSFIILHNNISSLNYSPAIVKEDFICSHNPLKDLEGLISVQGAVFTGVNLAGIKSQKFVYNNVATYKYSGISVIDYLEKVYVTLSDEEKIFEETKIKLSKAISDMIFSHALKKEMITDTLIKNLSKYNLLELKEKVLLIKNPPKAKEKRNLSQMEITKLAFETEL